MLNSIVEIGQSSKDADLQPLLVKGLRKLNQRFDASIVYKLVRISPISIKVEIGWETGEEQTTYYFQKPLYVLSVKDLQHLFDRFIPIIGEDVIIVASSSGSAREREFASWGADKAQRWISLNKMDKP